ncbi:hypothetical protein N7G274_000611 [Stereocaulon virgatum]|uniref:CHAT domain-containing protein n=1 Tax=Stereocaulon virgatum TaxID=373712 RepID=A0ABR4AT24_9LECA
MPCIRIVADVCSVIDERLVWNVSIEHDAGSLRQVKLRDPFSAAQERECKWYLERFTRSPFAVERATIAEGSLREYGRSLFVQLRLAEFRQLWSVDSSEFDIEVVQCPQSTNDESGSPSIHRLHWELLEEGTLWSLDSVRISIRRHLAQKGDDKSAGTSGGKSPRESSHSQGATFNALLVVARDLTLDGAAYEDVDASCALRALLSIRDALADSTSSPTLSIEVVRPGTLPALKEHLNRYPDGHFDIVHFDTHGIVRKYRGIYNAYLMFADAASATDLCPIRADTVGSMLSAKGIHLAVLNSCNSARSDHGLPANIASILINHGVTNVLAMSYEFMVSTVPLFLNAFYRCFFLQGLPFSRAAAFSRYVLKRQSIPSASFGLTVDLQDWFVPTVYTNGLDARFSYGIAGKPMSKALDDMSSADIELGTYDNISLTGRDLDKLRFERELVENRAVYIHGPAEIGKSAILGDLTREWRETDFAEVIHVDFAQVPHITLDVIIEKMDSQLSFRSTRGAPSERSPALLFQMLRLKKTILVFDSLDIPYSYMIQEWRKEKNLEDYHRDYVGVHKFILSLAELALNRPEPMFILVLIGRKDRPWIQEQLPGLDVSAFELSALSLPAAISLGERVLTAHGVQPETLRRSDSLVHIMQMLQKLPGALKLVLPKASKHASLESFRQALLHGDVTLTATDVKAEPLPSNRFLRVLDTLDDLQLQYPLAPF